MKNRLEDEYRQLMQNETPDLWERISAGIDAKIEEKRNTEIEVAYEESKHTVSAKKKVVSFVKKYSLPLVACIAAALCVPLMLTGFLRMADSAKSETAAADMEVAESDSVMAEAPAEQYFAAAVAEEAVAEEAVAEETAETENVTTTESAMTHMDDLSKECSEVQEERNSLKGVTQILTILSFSAEEGVLNEDGANGTVYYVTTEEEGACTVFVSSEQAFVIDLNQQLKIVVSQGNDDYDYVFVEIAD